MSTHRIIRPGQLCLIIGGRNAGLQCTTVRTLIRGELIPEMAASQPRALTISELDCWLVQGPSLTAKSEKRGVYRDTNGYSLVRPEWLLPIEPNTDLTLTEIKKIKVPNQPELTV